MRNQAHCHFRLAHSDTTVHPSLQTRNPTITGAHSPSFGAPGGSLLHLFALPAPPPMPWEGHRLQHWSMSLFSGKPPERMGFSLVDSGLFPGHVTSLALFLPSLIIPQLLLSTSTCWEQQRTGFVTLMRPHLGNKESPGTRN